MELWVWAAVAVVGGFGGESVTFGGVSVDITPDGAYVTFTDGKKGDMKALADDEAAFGSSDSAYDPVSESPHTTIRILPPTQ